MRALGWFWGVVLGVLVTGAAVLQILGPPARPVLTAVAVVAKAAPVSWDGHIAAPDSALLEPVHGHEAGQLPRIAADGRMSRVVYARPAPPSDGRPRIGLVIAGVGGLEAESRTAISLPGAVTLAVSAYGRDPEVLLAAARLAGHELLASIPMEADRFPLDDAGPNSLLTGAVPAENQVQLVAVLGRIEGYVGATGASDGLRGERFAAQTSSYNTMLDELARRGLLYLDPRPAGGGHPASLPAGLAGCTVDVVLDDRPARAEVEAQLLSLERIARDRGSAIGLVGRLRPMILERLAAWTQDVEARGVVLVPISALAQVAPATASATQ